MPIQKSVQENNENKIQEISLSSPEKENSKEKEETKKNSLEEELAEIRQKISTKNEMNQTIKN